MPILRLDNVSLSYGRKPLLDDAALQVRKGERVCLLGRNGEGKSSLLRLIARDIAPDGGEVWVRPGVKVATLAQEVAGSSEKTVLDIVMEGVHTAGLDGDWEAALQVEQVLARLELDADARLSTLSGGWRRRVMLGRALVSSPDLLLLDEPTNHLDIEAIGWLEDMMLDFAGALLFVSHDRAFVRRLATRIVELDRGRLRVWPGSYDQYVVLKAATLQEEARHAALFDKKLAQEEVWIRRGVEARRTRNEGRVRALEQLRAQRGERRDVIGRIDVRVQEAAASGRLVFEAEHVTHSFAPVRPADPPLIADFSARIMRGDRIGIIGANGCGKSTLIKLLMGEIEPAAGTIRRGTSLAPAYFDQQRDQLNPAASIADNVTGGSGDTVTIDGQARHVSGYLRDFLFPPDRLQAPVSMLSGGERNRLLLARLFARPSNLLVMDEPTNDLDAETLELLEELIANYAGTLLLVSHDRAFIDNVVTSTLVFEGAGRIHEYVGGYTDWLRQRRPPQTKGASPSSRPSPASAAAPKPTPAAASKPIKLSYRERRELDALPQKIQQLESEQSLLAAAIGDPELFRRDPQEAAAVLQRSESVSQALEAAFARWEALEALARP